MGKANILIVEDNAIIAHDLKVRLEQLGYAVPFIAAMGSEAINRVKEDSIDLVLMDILLSGEMDGIEAATKIREKFEIPVIYLTAHTDKATLKRAKVTGAYGYLVKPVSDTEMLSTIEVAIYKSWMERELRESEEKYSALVEAAKDGVVILQDQIYKFANREMANIIGYSVEELIGMNVIDTVAPEFRQLIAERYKSRMEGGHISSTYGFKVLCKGGEKKDVELSASLIQYKGKPASMGIVRDVTERKKSEEELKAATIRADDEKSKSDAIIEGIWDAISIQDTNYKIMYQNKLHQDYVGSHEGKYCYSAYEKNDDVCQGCPVAMTFVDGKAHTTERSITIDAALVTFEITASPIRNSSGEIVAGIEIIRDITERKNTEEELRNHREKLVGLVEERTTELSAANELLREEIAERRALEKAILETEKRELQRIGYELHDGLGQIITGLSLKSQSLEDMLKEKSLPEAENAGRITCLIDQAQEHLRLLMHGSLPMEAFHNNIVSSLEDLASMTTRDFDLQCNYKGSQFVKMDSSASCMHLYRIAQEAVTNAMKHAQPACIEISLEKENNVIRLTVKDDGAGMADVHSTENGLGLKIMNYRANMIGASLDIQSEINGGTSVICSFTEVSCADGAISSV